MQVIGNWKQKSLQMIEHKTFRSVGNLKTISAYKALMFTVVLWQCAMQIHFLLYFTSHLYNSANTGRERTAWLPGSQ